MLFAGLPLALMADGVNESDADVVVDSVVLADAHADTVAEAYDTWAVVT